MSVKILAAVVAIITVILVGSTAAIVASAFTAAPTLTYTVKVQDTNGRYCYCSNAGQVVITDSQGREITRTTYSSKSITAIALDQVIIRDYWFKTGR